jgi:uncharacterized protein YgfB (UPF0149 family)
MSAVGYEFSNLNFNLISDALRQLKSTNSASEAHGVMCGFICLGHRSDALSWWQFVAGEVPERVARENTQSQPLFELYRYSWQSITQMDHQFELLLPGEDVSLNDRAEALGDWCHGFLLGLGLAGLVLDNDIYQELRDALLHISEISNIDYDRIDVTDEEKLAFFEVREYMRFATLALYAQLTGHKLAESALLHSSGDTLH